MQQKKRSRITVPPIPPTSSPSIRTTTSVTDMIASGVAASTSTSSLFGYRKPSGQAKLSSVSAMADLMACPNANVPHRKVGIAGASPNITLKENNTDYYIDLMNDWEIGGTQNKWVCPSDRHLQLRAQLKSGWSVRTSTARSPTNNKMQTGGITEEEQEQIRKVLERAEAGRVNEQERIGRMVDRLEKMRTRATGNGVTQCLLCQTEFGLLASKSYAAMCSDCRKYVCQKNCGIDTYDHRRKETVFLCKICSEYREVMWKKSGAWFYREMPDYVRPASENGFHTPTTAYQHIGRSPVQATPTANSTPTGGGGMWTRKSNTPIPPSVFNNNTNGTVPNGRHCSAGPPTSRQLPLPNDQQQRLKCSPRPRITPSWVNEKVQSSMSIDDDDAASSSSSNEGDFKQCGIPLRRHHGNAGYFPRPRDLLPQRQNSQGSNGSSSRNIPSVNRQKVNLQRFALASRSRITDTDDSENESHRSTPSLSPRHSVATPSTSPRHSVATPSSYGGDDFTQNHSSTAVADASDAKSIDSGVVQSDHSAQQASMAHSFSNHVIPTVAPTFHATPSRLSSTASSASTTPNPPPIPPRKVSPIPPALPMAQPPPAPKPERRFSQCAGTQTMPSKEFDVPQPTFMSSPDDEPKQWRQRGAFQRQKNEAKSLESGGGPSEPDPVRDMDEGCAAVKRTTTNDDSPDETTNGATLILSGERRLHVASGGVVGDERCAGDEDEDAEEHDAVVPGPAFFFCFRRSRPDRKKRRKD
uniref:RabBD domain-containing protein n=1 Tax=Steinernema glaseri TaxID=37863 RepID=A0A1I8AG77_9BILA